jgi:hypothetical protein
MVHAEPALWPRSLQLPDPKREVNKDSKYAEAVSAYLLIKAHDLWHAVMVALDGGFIIAR